MAYINLPGLGTSGNEDIEMISISMCMYVYGYIYIDCIYTLLIVLRTKQYR